MKKNKPIIIWLLSGCFLIFIMVVIGGITRLTDSGLSMVNWNLFMGTIPPLNKLEWETTFNLYKQYPEYKKINFNITLEEFKSIFFWEYLHRMIGRLLGLVFIIPFIFFLIKKKLNKKLIIQSMILFFLGALQAFIGWWMVKSGLVNKPDVSHYRLSIHLITAFLTCGYTFWIALTLIFPEKKKGNKKLFQLLLLFFIILIIQIIYGGFVAGLNAGMGFNTWPKMGDKWIPESVYSLQPFWKNFVEAKYGVQFIHRSLGFLIVAIILLILIIKKNYVLTNKEKNALNITTVITLTQVFLGIFTLILFVPIVLASIHQITAFLLLMSTIYCLFLFKKSY